VATSPEELLNRLGLALAGELGAQLLSLSVHGSWVAGDFKSGRSDLDLVALLADDPDEATLTRLAALHAAIAGEAPEWDQHVEVDYVSVAAVQAVLSGGPAGHRMVRISPGEQIHLVSAVRHYLLNWWAAREHGQLIVGRPPSELLAVIPDALVREVVLEHARQWPAWLEGAHSPGFLAYAVLTLCRALALLSTGQQRSKHAAAAWAGERMPEWGELIRWADTCWYEGAPGDPGARFDEVTAFVQEMSRLAASIGAERPPDPSTKSA
jgi:hypothetical protein